MAAHLLHLGVEGLETAVQLAVLGHGGVGGHLQRRNHAEDVARAHAGTEERCVGLHGNLLEAGVLHRHDVALEDVDQLTVEQVVVLLGRGRALDEELHARALHLGVGVDADDRLLVVGHRVGLLLRSVGGRCGNVAHQRLDLRLHGVDIHVTHDDDGLVVGTVPAVVEVHEFLVLEVLQPVEVADQVAVLVLRALADGLEHLHRRTPRGAVARAQLLHDDAALGVDLIGLQGDEVRPVVQDQQRRVDDAFARGRHVADVVDRLVPARTGVEVGAELHADRLQILGQHLAREVLRAVEGHVLEEVGQALLRVVLLDGADVVQDVEVGLPLGLFVVADVVGHSVLQLARADLVVHRDRRHRIELRHGAARGEEHRQQHRYFFHRLFHY